MLQKAYQYKSMVSVYCIDTSTGVFQVVSLFQNVSNNGKNEHYLICLTYKSYINTCQLLINFIIG